MNAPTMKPCPFCGSPALVRRWPVEGASVLVYCGAIKACEVLPGTVGATLGETARYWNQRTKPKRSIWQRLFRRLS